jgi:hypothetical protein
MVDVMLRDRTGERWSIMTQSQPEAGLQPDRPNAARMFDYYLGGKDNFAADRAAAEMVLQVAPWMPEAARQGRELISRTVRHLVEERGIRQILDLGSGLPTQDNVHEIAHRIDPDVRVVYVDNDPVVCTHGRALLADSKTVSVVRGRSSATRRSVTRSTSTARSRC